jgi:carnitine 3-dehydrogenase
LFHALHRRRDDVLVATGEQMYLHVDTNAGKAALMDFAVREKLVKIRAAQSRLAPPAQAGRHVGLPRT